MPKNGTLRKKKRLKARRGMDRATGVAGGPAGGPASGPASSSSWRSAPQASSRTATGDDRWVVALHYRIQRKRLWRLAEEVLTTHLDELGKDDAAPAA